jgi:hypothetical protein
VSDTIDPLLQSAAALPEPMQRKAEQQREQQYLQDLAFRKGVDDCDRNNVEHKIHDALLLSSLRVRLHGTRIERSDIDVHALARSDQIDNDQANHQRDRTDDFEIQ